MEKFFLLPFFLCSNVISWNFETKTAIVFKGQHDSYFGFSVALHENSKGILALITATKDSSTKIKRSGVLYQCRLSDGNCEEVDLKEDKRDDEIKEDMWLGVSLDVQPNYIVTCGHLWKISVSDLYLPLGACYIMDKELINVKRIVPFRGTEGLTYTVYSAFAQSGMSVCFTQDNNNLLIGSPGINDWKGSMVRYKFENNEFNGKEYLTFDLKSRNFDNYTSYFGYSVTSGRFFQNTTTPLFAAGAPRDGNYKGKVYIFEETMEYRHNERIIMEKTGIQLGEYFGASILGVDVNNDGLSDLLVGAPLFSTFSGGEEGRVYIYHSIGSYLEHAQIIYGNSVPKSRFGTSIANIGDVNQDNFSDIAIGAPYELDKGAIYIYHGSDKGIVPKFAQRIFAEDIDKSLRGFGISISRSKDIDFNNYPDFLVGSYLSDRAILIRSHPIVRINAQIEFRPPQIHPKFSTCNNTDQPCFKILYCLKYFGKFVPKTLNFVASLHSFRLRNGLKPREYFLSRNRSVSFIQESFNITENKWQCFSVDTYIHEDSEDLISPIQINVNFDLAHDTSKDITFCKDCPVLDPTQSYSTSEVITFLTGCSRNDKCLSDLVLEADVFGLSDGELILGKDNVITINIKMKNLEEPAFQTELKIDLPDNVEVINGENCKHLQDLFEKLILICPVGNPLYEKTIIKEIKLDSSKISSSIEQIFIFINSTTLSEEINPENNFANITIPIKLSADITIAGRTDQEQILLKEDKPEVEIYEITHIYNVIKYLHSPISSLTVNFYIPTYLIDTKMIFFHLKSVRIHNPDQSSSVLGKCNFINKDEDIVEMEESSSENFNSSESRSKRSADNHVMFEDLNKNPVLNCYTSVCEKIECSIGPFVQRKKSSTFHITGYINVTVLRLALKEWDNLKFISEGIVTIDDMRANIQPENHRPDDCKVLTDIVRSITLKSKMIAKWILPFSITFGIIIIIIIHIALQRLGFFRRKRKEDMEALKANLQRPESSY